MDAKEILKFCIERGLLVEPSVLELLSEAQDRESVEIIIEKLKSQTQKRIITKTLLVKNTEAVNNLFLSLPKKNQESLEKLKIKLGLQIEIYKESSKKESLEIIENLGSNIKILSNFKTPEEKINVGCFVKNLRSRFNLLKNILQERPEMENLTSINKLSRNSQKASIIGFVSDKRTTKNRNILVDVEDFSGTTRILINQNKPELYESAEDIALDSVLGFSGTGDKEIFFANNIIFPDAFLSEKKNSHFDESVAFLGDVHYGSKLFLEENFLKFIDYLNGAVPNTPEAKKIKYLFFVGDVVTGVGNYPAQEKDLEIVDLEEQFIGFSKLLGKIRKDIKIIISPGNHDGVRLMEPQPLFDEKYAWALYEMENVFLTGNPCYVNIGSGENFSGFDVLTYHGFSYTYYANNNPSLMRIKAMNSPDSIMKYLLKTRHLAPTHASTQRFPSEEDFLVIKKIPDIFVSGHVHKSAVSYYNNILVISTSCWESMTEYQEKFGNEPDHCKVPVFNFKTREIKILDFE